MTATASFPFFRSTNSQPSSSRMTTRFPSPIFFIVSPERRLCCPATERRCRQLRLFFIHAKAAAGNLEETADLLREDSLSPTAHAPPRVIEFSAAQISDAIENLLLAVSKVLLQPSLDQRSHRPGKAQHDEASPFRARVACCLENGRDFMIGDRRNHGSDHDSSGNTGRGQFRHRV